MRCGRKRLRTDHRPIAEVEAIGQRRPLWVIRAHGAGDGRQRRRAGRGNDGELRHRWLVRPRHRHGRRRGAGRTLPIRHRHPRGPVAGRIGVSRGRPGLGTNDRAIAEVEAIRGDRTVRVRRPRSVGRHVQRLDPRRRRHRQLRHRRLVARARHGHGRRRGAGGPLVVRHRHLCRPVAGRIGVGRGRPRLGTDDRAIAEVEAIRGDRAVRVRRPRSIRRHVQRLDPRRRRHRQLRHRRLVARAGPLELERSAVRVGHRPEAGVRGSGVIAARVALGIGGRPVGRARVGVVDRRRARQQVEIPLPRVCEPGIGLLGARVLPARRAVVRHR